MRAIAISFSSRDAQILWDSEVRDRDCDVQGGLINIMTQQETDGCYPERGTRLFNRALQGLLLNPVGAQHQCNFAAVDVLRFSRQHDYAFERIAMRPRELEGDRIPVDVSFQMADQTVIGRAIEIP